MPTRLRLVTFNLENLGDKPGPHDPALADRIRVLRPQLLRLRADVLCLQEIHGQESPGQPRDLLALKALVATTPYETYDVATTATKAGPPFAERNPPPVKW